MILRDKVICTYNKSKRNKYFDIIATNIIVLQLNLNIFYYNYFSLLSGVMRKMAIKIVYTLL